MNTSLFESLQQTLEKNGPAQAIDTLCQSLKESNDYAGLFYAMLMKKRHELGLNPIPTGSNQDIPAHAQEKFEEGIRDAARTVGKLYLDEGNIPQAWMYFRMLGESQPVADALAKLEPAQDQDIQPLVEIAFHHGVLPEKGFEWVLQRYGMCSAVTVLSGETHFAPEHRARCIHRLVKALHHELMERLRGEIERQQGFAPTATSIPALIEGRDWLFADEFYHIDLSHLNSTVQMAMQLEKCPELSLVRELCAYGKRLSPRFHFNAEPPFERQYHDYDHYLAVLMGDDVEANLQHFKNKLVAENPEDQTTFPAEVLINLLVRIGRSEEALEIARQHLPNTENARLSCPGITELCQQTKNYKVLAEVAKGQGNAVNYLAGLIAGR